MRAGFFLSTLFAAAQAFPQRNEGDFINSGIGGGDAARLTQTSETEEPTTTITVREQVTRVISLIRVSKNGTTSTSPNTESTESTLDLINFPTSGAGASYASACNRIYTEYNRKYFTDVVQNDAWPNVTSLTSYFYNFTTSRNVISTECYTLCDGHCRVKGTKVVSTNYTTSSGWETTTLIEPSPFTYPSPKCTINEDDCAPILSDYKSSQAVFDELQSSWFSATRANPDVTATITSPAASLNPWAPPCNEPSTSIPSSELCGRCFIGASQAHLIYFSLPTNVSRDMCAQTPTVPPGTGGWGNATETYSHRPPQTEGQYSTVLNGSTYWDNSLYIVFTSLGAYDNCNTIGKVRDTAIVTLMTSELSSLRGFYGSQMYPFNLADLIEPVPWVAWYGQSMCRYSEDCMTITPGGFHPMVAIPPQVRELDPAWGDCERYFRGVFDPPTALARATDLGEPEETGAIPASSPTHTGAPVTTPPPASTPVPAESDVQPDQSTEGPVQDPPHPDPPETMFPSDFPTPPQQSNSLPDPSAPADPNEPEDPADPADPADPTGSADPADPNEPNNNPLPPQVSNGNNPGNTPKPTSGGNPNNPVAPPAPIPITTIDSTPIHVDPAQPSIIIIGPSATLVPGATTSIGTTPIVLSPDGKTLQVGPSAISIPDIPSPPPAAPTSTFAVINIGTRPVTAAPTGSAVVIDGTVTLTPGGSALTTNGQTISVIEDPTSGVVLVTGSGTATGTVGWETDANGGGGNGTATRTGVPPAEYTGAAVERGSAWWRVCLSAVVVVLLAMT